MHENYPAKRLLIENYNRWYAVTIETKGKNDVSRETR